LELKKVAKLLLYSMMILGEIVAARRNVPRQRNMCTSSHANIQGTYTQLQLLLHRVKRKKTKNVFSTPKSFIHSFIEGTEPTGEDDSNPPEKEEENPRKNEGREKQR
jgi:hypothetical protein